MEYLEDAIEADPSLAITPATAEDLLKTTGDTELDKWLEEANNGTFDLGSHVSEEDRERTALFLRKSKERGGIIADSEPSTAEPDGFSDTY